MAKGDPYWITVKYPTICRRCGRPIKRGDRAFYFPSTRAAFCAGDRCGGREHRSFQAVIADGQRNALAPA